MSEIAPTQNKKRRQSAPSIEFVIKEKLDSGAVIWVNPQTAEEITLNGGTVPTPANLAMLAANGIVPQVPTLDDYEERQQQITGDADPVIEETALSRILTRVKAAPSDLRSEVLLKRVKPDGQLSHCGKFTVDEYEQGGEELIRAAFGPGKYRVFVYGPSLSQDHNYGKFCRLANELVEIEASLVPLKTGNSSGGVDSSLAMILQRMEQRIDQLAAGGGNSPDTFAMFERFAQIQKMMGGGGGGSRSLGEQIKEMQALRAFMKDMGGGENDDGEKEPGMMALAGKAMELIASNKANTIPQSDISGPVPGVSLPASFSAPQPQLAATPAIPESEDMNNAQALVGNIIMGALVKAAERNDSIDTHAPGLFEKLPDEMMDLLELPIWFDVLIETFPAHTAAITQYKPWFEALRAKILEMLYEPDEEETPAAPAAPATSAKPVAATKKKR